MRIRCYVFRNPLGDCTNNGVSSRFDEVILSWDEDDPPQEINGTPVLRLVKRKLNGEYLHAEPVIPGRKLKANSPTSHYMSGGNFIYCCDSRFPHRYPIGVHDRLE